MRDHAKHRGRVCGHGLQDGDKEKRDEIDRIENKKVCRKKRFVNVEQGRRQGEKAEVSELRDPCL